MSKEKDEKVDGAKIAADILSRMPAAHREKVVKAMEKVDPAVTVKVAERLFDFNDIATLTPQGAQVLINAVDHKDLVISLKTASSEVKEVLFGNMSQRKAQLVKDDFTALPKIRISEVEDAQRRILKILDELRSSGQIRTQSKNDIWV